MYQIGALPENASVGVSATGLCVRHGGSGGGSESGGYSAIFNFRCSFREYVETSEIDHIEINGYKVMLNRA